MPKQILAITTCRVSTSEQVENNSLNRQAEAVKKAAKELGATIPDDGQWSGNVSSKVGNNINRKDLKAMLEYCKKHPQVKYLLVHEVDRFMRSVDELFYFEVLFRKEVGVKIIYASQPELNTDDYKAKLFKALEAFKGETSNVERINKSIAGQTDALKEGRYPFAPKPGYQRGYERGIQEIHPVRGPILGSIFIKVVTKQVTPTDGLIELNNSDFVKGHSLYKMDKFRKIVTDPFYAGIVEVDKQVKVRNENGLHKPLITKEQHYELVRIMSDKKKTQTGPRKNGNPKYPMSNLVSCSECTDKTNGRIVGFDHGNGKNPALVYEKYRCRACKRYLTRQELHPKILKLFKDSPVTDKGLRDLMKALNIVWKQKEGQDVQEIARIGYKIKLLKEAIVQQVEAATDPANVSIRDNIHTAIASKKAEISELEERLVGLSNDADADREQFLEFAFDFVRDMGSNFLDTNLVSTTNRLRCKQVVFPAGFYLDANNNVYTPEISPLYRLATTKKDAEASNKSQLVRVRGL